MVDADGITLPAVTVLGLGGGGGRIVAEFAAMAGACESLTVIAADSDRRALEQVNGPRRLLLGPDVLAGQSCGDDPLNGERAANASLGELRQHIEGAELLIVAAGFGKGAGSGAAKTVARAAREAGVTTVVVGTLPFGWEGQSCREKADHALANLRSIVDTVLAIPNDLLFNALSASTPAADAFQLADYFLAEAIRALTQMRAARGLIQADFEALARMLRRRAATCSFGVGRGTGGERWRQALDELLECPTFGGVHAMEEAHAAIITLTGPPDLSIGELRLCMDAVKSHLSERATQVVGAYTSPEVNTVQIAAFLCNFATGPQPVDPAPADAQLSLFSPAAAHAPNRAGTPGDRSRPGGPVQGELEFQEQSFGIFGNGPHTIARNGENLDIPTFQRKGIHLDTGD